MVMIYCTILPEHLCGGTEENYETSHYAGLGFNMEYP
jgi:hypothetical protein